MKSTITVCLAAGALVLFGALLVRSTPASVTLVFGGGELAVHTSGGASNATRPYPGPDEIGSPPSLPTGSANDRVAAVDGAIESEPHSDSTVGSATLESTVAQPAKADGVRPDARKAQPSNPTARMALPPRTTQASDSRNRAAAHPTQPLAPTAVWEVVGNSPRPDRQAADTLQSASILPPRDRGATVVQNAIRAERACQAEGLFGPARIDRDARASITETRKIAARAVASSGATTLAGFGGTYGQLVRKYSDRSWASRQSCL